MGTDQTKDRFLAAISRLKKNEPTNIVLLDKSARGELEISILSVAMEAGLSRRLIGHEKCEYKEIRDEVQRLILERSEAKTGETTRALLRRLYLEVSELKDQLTLRDLIHADSVVEKYRTLQGLTVDGRPKNPKSPAQRRAELRVVKPQS